MNVTAKEAKEKLCPVLSNELSCMGPKCMWWDWDETPKRKFIRAYNEKAVKEPDRFGAIPRDYTWLPHDGCNPAGWAEPITDSQLRRTGHCSHSGATR